MPTGSYSNVFTGTFWRHYASVHPIPPPPPPSRLLKFAYWIEAPCGGFFRLSAQPQNSRNPGRGGGGVMSRGAANARVILPAPPPDAQLTDRLHNSAIHPPPPSFSNNVCKFSTLCMLFRLWNTFFVIGFLYSSHTLQYIMFWKLGEERLLEDICISGVMIYDESCLFFSCVSPKKVF